MSRLLDSDSIDTGIEVGTFKPTNTQRKVVTPTLGNLFAVQEVGDIARISTIELFASLPQSVIMDAINNETQTFFVEKEGTTYTCISIDTAPSLTWRRFNRGSVDTRNYTTSFMVSITAEV